MIQPDATVQIFFALKTLQCRHVFKNSYFALHQKRNDFIDPSEQSVKKKKKKRKEKENGTQMLGSSQAPDFVKFREPDLLSRVQNKTFPYK